MITYKTKPADGGANIKTRHTSINVPDGPDGMAGTVRMDAKQDRRANATIQSRPRQVADKAKPKRHAKRKPEAKR